MKHVLIIDDDEGMLRVLVDYVTGLGFDCVTASNGEEGLRIALHSRVDLVLSDLHMPKFDGFCTLMAWKKSAQLASIPFILMTGDHDPDNRMEAKKLGAAGFLYKPVRFAELRDLLSTHLDGSPISG